MSDCLFCKIVSQEIPAKIVFQDDQAVAFRDINPTAPTHVLVVPKKHIATIDDVAEGDEALMGHLFRVASQVAAAEGLLSHGDELQGGRRTVGVPRSPARGGRKALGLAAVSAGMTPVWWISAR